MIEMVRLDPTGNLTCLVTRKERDADEAAITRTLMGECEQVAYLELPTTAEARARIRLMGGEFCGNAAMAGACYLAGRDGILPGEEQTVPLEVSGAAGVLRCKVRRTESGYEGPVPMPGIESLTMVREGSFVLTAVRTNRCCIRTRRKGCCRSWRRRCRTTRSACCSGTGGRAS